MTNKGEFDDSITGSIKKTRARKSSRVKNTPAHYADFTMGKQKNIVKTDHSSIISENIAENISENVSEIDLLHITDHDMRNIPLSSSQTPLDDIGSISGPISGDWADIIDEDISNEVEVDVEEELPVLLLPGDDDEDELADSGDESEYEEISDATTINQGFKTDDVPGLLIDKNNKNAPIINLGSKNNDVPGLMIDKNNKNLRIIATQCGTGFRSDCPRKATCFYHHTNEKVGELVSKYVNIRWAQGANKGQPKTVKKVTGANAAKEKVQCPSCPNSFASNHGLKIHVSRMHPDTNNTQCHSNVDNNSHRQSNVEKCYRYIFHCYLGYL